MTTMPTPDAGSLAGTALETLGAVIDGDLGRDAIHLAAIAVEAAERLFPGQDVGLLDDKRASTKVAETIAIVDPFVRGQVNKGQWFWMILYPRTITSLRHVWTHPAFGEAAGATPSAVSAAEAEKWLEDFCRNADCPPWRDLKEALLGKTTFSDDDDYGYSIHIDGDYLHVGGQDAHGEIPAAFWFYAEIAIGKPIPNRPNYFSCSC